MANIIPYNKTLNLGKGYNSLKGETLGSVFLNPQFEESIGANGQEIDFFMKRIDSSESLHESLGVSVDVDANVGPFFSMEGSFKYNSSSSYNSNSVFYLVYMKVSNATKFIRNDSMAVKPEIIQMLKDGDEQNFRSGFGDSFVSGLITGGEFYALYEIVCTDKTERKEISASLEMSAGSFVSGIDISVKFNSTMDRISKRCTINLNVHQVGGKGADTNVPQSIGEIIARVKVFPTIVAGEGAVIYNVITESYKTLVLPKGPNYIELENKRYLLSEYARDIVKLRTTLSDLKYMLLNADQFHKKNAQGEMTDLSRDKEGYEHLAGQAENLGQYILEYMNIAKGIADSAAKCEKMLPQRKLDLADLPERKNNLDGVIIFSGAGFTGNATFLQTGKYAAPGEFHLDDNSIASVKIPGQLKVRMYAGTNFTDANFPVTQSIVDISSPSEENPGLYSLAGKISSIKVMKISDPDIDTAAAVPLNDDSEKSFTRIMNRDVEGRVAAVGKMARIPLKNNK